MGRPEHRTLRTVLSIGAAVLVGLVIGAGGFGVYYSNAASYLSSDPSACVNCHVMKKQYDGWVKGPHANVATCDDCHLPQDNAVSKYVVQVEDGFLHGSKFTTGDYPENIRIRESSLAVTNAACLSCHGDLTNDMRRAMGATDDSVTCTHCHADVGHK